MKSYLSRMAREVKPYTAGEQPSDRKYVKLNTNENPYPPSPRAQRAFLEFDFSSLNLYPSLTMDHLKNNIACAEGVAPENIFCGNGSDEILALCFPAFFDRGGEGVAFADITYSFYPVFCNFFQIKANIVNVEDDFTLNLSKLTRTAAQGIIVANPNAPTGIGIARDEMEEFIRANAERIVIIDEAYMPFFNQSAVPLVKKYKNLVIVKTFSKGYSLAGMRCGYAVADPGLIDGLERMKNCFNSYPVDRVCQAVCAAAIADSDYYREMNGLVVLERERAGRELMARGFDVLPSKANFIFVKHRKLSGQTVYEQLRARGVLVRHFNKPKISEYCRITIGSKEQNDRLFEALDEFI